MSFEPGDSNLITGVNVLYLNPLPPSQSNNHENTSITPPPVKTATGLTV